MENQILENKIVALEGRITSLEAALSSASRITEGTLDGSKVNIVNVQKSNLVDSDSDFVQSEWSAIKDSVNFCVKKGDLINQLNWEAGRVLIHADKLTLDGATIIKEEQ